MSLNKAETLFFMHRFHFLLRFHEKWDLTSFIFIIFGEISKHNCLMGLIFIIKEKSFLKFIWV